MSSKTEVQKFYRLTVNIIMRADGAIFARNQREIPDFEWTDAFTKYSEVGKKPVVRSTEGYERLKSDLGVKDVLA